MADGGLFWSGGLSRGKIVNGVSARGEFLGWIVNGVGWWNSLGSCFVVWRHYEPRGNVVKNGNHNHDEVGRVK